MGFNDILGHEQIKEHLHNTVQTRKVSHAYILSGGAGMGRKSLVNTSALSLLYKEGAAKPCIQCHACRQVFSGDHPDPIYVTHEKPANIGVDDIRGQISNTIRVRPYSSYYKIYVVDEAEKMTVQTQNAPLKTIKEPPAYTVILLLTTNQNAFLSTIPSRCVQLELRPLKDLMVKEYLIQSLGENESEVDIYAAFARGNLDKTTHLAQSEEFGVMYREILHLLKHIKDMDISRLLDCIHKVKEENLGVQGCLDFIQMWYRDILMRKTTKDINLLILRDEFSAVRGISTVSSYDDLEEVPEAIDKARIRLDANVNTRLVVELVLPTMRENQNVSGL